MVKAALHLRVGYVSEKTHYSQLSSVSADLLLSSSQVVGIDVPIASAVMHSTLWTHPLTLPSVEAGVMWCHTTYQSRYITVIAHRATETISTNKHCHSVSHDAVSQSILRKLVPYVTWCSFVYTVILLWSQTCLLPCFLLSLVSLPNLYSLHFCSSLLFSFSVSLCFIISLVLYFLLYYFLV